MTSQQTVHHEDPDTTAVPTAAKKRGRLSRVLTLVVLTIGAFAFLFPFYYMVVGSLQKEPDTSVAGAFPSLSNITGHNFFILLKEKQPMAWIGLSGTARWSAHKMLQLPILYSAICPLLWKSRHHDYLNVSPGSLPCN